MFNLIHNNAGICIIVIYDCTPINDRILEYIQNGQDLEVNFRKYVFDAFLSKQDTDSQLFLFLNIFVKIVLLMVLEACA